MIPMRSRSARTARQLRKIAELKVALIREGYLTLDAQAAALGLGRSTTWNILRATAAVHDYPPQWNAATGQRSSGPGRATPVP